MSERIRRLNWGCGTSPKPGWLNSDIKEAPGVDVPADIRTGLPIETGTIKYAVSIHALQELPYREQVPALAELRRLLEPGGVLRLGLPDLERGFEAYRRGDRGYFQVPDDVARTLGGKLAVQLTWFGYSRMVYVSESIEELLVEAGFREIRHTRYRETASGHPEIVELDSREAESLFVEATK
jgi:predicted SAM-dependent methyltransferase